LLLAQQVVSRTLAGLPVALRSAAAECPIELVDMAVALREEVGLEPDLLGLFDGCSRLDAQPEMPDQLPRIRLFLDNLWDFSENMPATYREEVRTTLLHELGHYLGLDEEDVAALGLA
jgi:predicted Zn-dependent protease with MMP-like domain